MTTERDEDLEKFMEDFMKNERIYGPKIEGRNQDVWTPIDASIRLQYAIADFATRRATESMEKKVREARGKAIQEWSDSKNSVQLLEFLMTQAARVMQATNAETLKMCSDMIGIGKRFDMKATLKDLKSPTN